MRNIVIELIANAWHSEPHRPWTWREARDVLVVLATLLVFVLGVGFGAAWLIKNVAG